MWYVLYYILQISARGEGGSMGDDLELQIQVLWRERKVVHIAPHGLQILTLFYVYIRLLRLASSDSKHQ